MHDEKAGIEKQSLLCLQNSKKRREDAGQGVATASEYQPHLWLVVVAGFRLHNGIRLKSFIQSRKTQDVFSPARNASTSPENSSGY